MRQFGKIALGLVVVALLAMPYTGTQAQLARVVQGAVMDVGAVDPFAGVCIDTRIWSAADQNAINGNSANCGTIGAGACTNATFDAANGSCPRSYVANLQTSGRPGYQSMADDQIVYNGGSPNQSMYILFEGTQNPAASNYITYYYAASQISAGTESGKISINDCSGTLSIQCFLPGYAARNAGSSPWPGAGDIAPIGGLSPIPVPQIPAPPVGNSVGLTWNGVQVFDNGDGTANPFMFFRVYRWIDPTTNNSCGAPLENDPAWLPIGTTPTPNFTDNGLPSGVDCVRYALKLVFNGPDNRNSFGTTNGELSTHFKGAASAGVSRNPAAVQITNFNGKYAGKGVINVRWTGLIETGLAGYNVQQSLDAAGPWRTVNPSMIVVKGDGSNYTLATQANRKDGATVWYQLELVKTDGSTSTIAPISVSIPK